MNFYLPVFMVVCSNVVYHLCAKSISPKSNTFATLAITYVIGAALTLTVYYMTSPEKKLVEEFSHLNWANLVLGFAIVGLEAGNILMYKAGWSISLGPIVTSISSALALILLGRLLFQEAIVLRQALGAVLCMTGLVLINLK